MSRDLSDLLIGDLRRHVAYLESMPAHLPQPEHRHGFHH
jgi:hypothetical protein